MWTLVKILFVAGTIGIVGWNIASGTRSQLGTGALESVAASKAILNGQVLTSNYHHAPAPQDAADQAGRAIETSEGQEGTPAVQQAAAQETDQSADAWNKQYPEGGKSAVN